MYKPKTAEVFTLLQCYTASIHTWLLKFWGRLSVPSSRDCLTLEDRTSKLSQNIKTNYHSTLHNISEQQTPHLQHGRSLRSQTGSCFAVQRIKLLLLVAYRAIKIHTMIFWGVTMCNLVGGGSTFHRSILHTSSSK